MRCEHEKHECEGIRQELSRIRRLNSKQFYDAFMPVLRGNLPEGVSYQDGAGRLAEMLAERRLMRRRLSGPPPSERISRILERIRCENRSEPIRIDLGCRVYKELSAELSEHCAPSRDFLSVSRFMGIEIRRVATLDEDDIQAVWDAAALGVDLSEDSE